MAPVIALILPFMGILFYCVKSYGTIDVKQYKGIGFLKLIGIVAWLLHIVILMMFDGKVYCNSCSRLDDMEEFILPSLAYGLIAFPQVTSVYAPSEMSAKTIESGAVFTGLFVLLYLYLFV